MIAWHNRFGLITTIKVRTYLGFLALLSALLACVPAFAGVTDYPFRLVTKPAGNEQQLVAQNDGPAPITVHVTLSGENFGSDRAWPLTTIVAPYSSVPLGRVFAADKTAGGYNFLFKYSHHFGRADASPDAGAVYRLPFEDGNSYSVTQAFGSKLSSHNNRENLYAVDFAMPIGSPVVAARAGTVIDVTLGYDEGGYDMRFLDKANTVAVVHDDGTVAEYAHLSRGPALVKPGQRVAAGTLLGYSGNSGYTSGPHLHFIVSKPEVHEGKVSRVSIPVVFYGNEPGMRFSATTGTRVTASSQGTYVEADQPLSSSTSGTGLTAQPSPRATN
jgi:murein DD-endopeptidase MepM/ murein hydrolase activator NlpD